jgi:hypothetical protein
MHYDTGQSGKPSNSKKLKICKLNYDRERFWPEKNQLWFQQNRYFDWKKEEEKTAKRDKSSPYLFLIILRYMDNSSKSFPYHSLTCKSLISLNCLVCLIDQYHSALKTR